MDQQPNESVSPICKTSSVNPETTDESETTDPPITLVSLFRFATKLDIFLMIIGSIAALAMGCAMPVFSLLWGKITDTYTIGGETMVEAAKILMIEFIGIGICVFLAGWIVFASWMISGERQAIACRKQYFRSLLEQEIAWFDQIDQSELSSSFLTDSELFQGAIGEKVSTVLMTIGMTISGFIIAFIEGWLLTLVLLVSLPCIAFTGYLFMLAIQNKDKAGEKNYAKAGGRAEQSIAAIKVVKQMNGEEFECERYKEGLISAVEKSFRYAVLSGVGSGAALGVMLFSYALGFWYGSVCVEGGSGCSAAINGGECVYCWDCADCLFQFVEYWVQYESVNTFVSEDCPRTGCCRKDIQDY